MLSTSLPKISLARSCFILFSMKSAFFCFIDIFNSLIPVSDSNFT